MTKVEEALAQMEDMLHKPDKEAKIAEAASHMATGFIALMKHARSMSAEDIDEARSAVLEQCQVALRPLFDHILTAVRDEREACAKIADDWTGSDALARALARNPKEADGSLRIVRGEAAFIAEAIRARGK